MCLSPNLCKTVHRQTEDNLHGKTFGVCLLIRTRQLMIGRMQMSGKRRHACADPANDN